MKKIFNSYILLVTLYFGFSSNINFIDKNKINRSLGDVTTEIEFLTKNEPIYSEFYTKWPFKDIPKDEVISTLKFIYNLFLDKKVIDSEVELLLGEIAHYLYNLDELDFFEISVKHYIRAIDLAPSDYKAYWFLAHHYAQSLIQDKSIEFFSKSQKLLPTNPPAKFWEEYAYAAKYANMPSTCLYSMDKAKAILKKESSFGTESRQSVKKLIEATNSQKSYERDILWTSSKEEKLCVFTSRTLGLEFKIDPNWSLEFYDYKNFVAPIVIIPPPLLNKDGRSISYTIMLFVKVVQKGDTLNTIITKMSNPEMYKNKEVPNLPIRYPLQIAYQYKNPNLYQKMGGARFLIITFERKRPEYPGLILEHPHIFPRDNKAGLHYYMAGNSKDRFRENIYYILMLDACEDIYEEAYEIFINFFNNQLIVE